MKTLFIGTAPPYGETYGMGHRARNIAKALSAFSELSVLAISRKEWSSLTVELVKAEHKYLGQLYPLDTPNSSIEKLKRLILPSYLNTNLQQLSAKDQSDLLALLPKFDMVWIHSIKVANLTGVMKWKKAVLDADDYPSNAHFTAMKNGSGLKYKARQFRKGTFWKLRERTLKHRFNALTVCKEEDREAFGVPDRTFAIPNCIDDFPIRQSSIVENQTLGMIGTFDYILNTQAIEWFIKTIWPTIKSKKPSANLRLIGRSSEKYTNESMGITGLGFIDDPAAEMSQWTAMIAPVSMGGGTSVKVAEAFSRKLPVISTSHGVRGYEVVNLREVIIGDNSKEFADACLKVLSDPELANRLATAARSYFEANLTWQSLVPKLKIIATSVREQSS